MGKRGESWLVVVLAVLLALGLFPFVSATGNCLYGSDVVEVTNPLDTIVVDFGEPVTVDILSDDIQFTFYPDSADAANFETSEAKSLELVSSEDDQIYKFRPVDEYQEKYRYSLFVRGYTKADGTDGVLLEQCKYIYVDYGPLKIEKTKPTAKYVADPAPQLEFRTNRKSECKISATSSIFDVMLGKLSTQDGYVHTGSFSGSEDFYVACKDVNDAIVVESFTIIIDTTKPLAPIIDDSSEITKYPDRTNQVSLLRAKFSSEDAESGIAFINYTVAEKESGLYVADWKTTTKTDEWIAISDLQLLNGKEYMIVAVAKNNAGLTSEQSTSDGILVDALFDPNNLGPAVFCLNGILDDGETYLDCGGICAGCTVGHECTEDKDCATKFCSGDTLLCTLPACDDGFMNGDESDIDCGGSCDESCALGLMCTLNSDCSSNYCLSGTCSQANCFDNVKNGDESDIDCGGNCDASCPANRRCVENSDCISQECDSFLKTCIGPETNKPTETNNNSNGAGLWIMVVISIVVLLGGGGYYLVSTGKIKLKNDSGTSGLLSSSGGKSSSTSNSSTSTNRSAVSSASAKTATATAQSNTSSSQSQPHIDTSLLAAKLRKDLNKKEQTRELSSLFGEFKNGKNPSFDAKQAIEKEDADGDTLVTKEEIDNLFGDVGSKSALNKLTLKKK